jgi:hypothetical protein
MRIVYRFDVNEMERVAIAWWQDGGDRFEGWIDDGTKFRKPWRKHKATREGVIHYVQGYGTEQIGELVEDYREWSQLPTESQARRR